MNSAQISIQIIVTLTAIACAIPGTFLVLRKMSLISDAISHSILLGIVVGFFIIGDTSSPLLIVLAACTGVITVFLVEFIQRTGLVKEDTAIGLVFPSLFSIGVILIAKNANDVHLDIDSVMVGDLSLAPFDPLLINCTEGVANSCVDLGPKAIWVIGSILLITLILLFGFFKELKVSTFDAGLAATMGFSPIIMHYGLMTVSSVTIVGAFDAVGPILVIALMIAPAATAYLITKDLKKMLWLSCVIGVFAAISGFWLAHFLDASISGSMTSVLGIIFLIVYLFAPSNGLLSVTYRRSQQKKEVMLLTFLLHLRNHSEINERHVKHLNEHINWQKLRSQLILDLALKNNMITISDNIVSLTEKGTHFTEKAIDYIIMNKDTEIESIKDDFFLFRG